MLLAQSLNPRSTPAVVAEWMDHVRRDGGPWWNRHVIDLSEIHQQILVQLPDSFVTRRMTDEICRNHQVRPRTIAEISAIKTLLRSLAPLKAATLRPEIALLGMQGLKLKAIRLRGKNLRLEIGLLRLKGSGGNSTVQAFRTARTRGCSQLVKKPNSTIKP